MYILTVVDAFVKLNMKYERTERKVQRTENNFFLFDPCKSASASERSENETRKSILIDLKIQFRLLRIE